MEGPVTLGKQDSTPERVDIIPPDKTGENVFVTEADTNPPIESYEETTKLPVCVDYFGEKADYGLDNHPMAEEFKAIDKWVKDELAINHRTPSTGSYRKVFDELKARLGVPDDSTNDLERIYGFVRAYEDINASLEKKDRNKLKTRLLNIARDKDFDSKTLVQVIAEEYMKSEGLWL